MTLTFKHDYKDKSKPLLVQSLHGKAALRRTIFALFDFVREMTTKKS